MWPWAHLAFGYLLYSLGSRAVRRTPPDSGLTVVALAFGTQFPDLVDKPLAWWLYLIPNGRSLAHSVFTFVVVALLLYGVARQTRWALPVEAFSFGYLTHIVGDALPSLLTGSGPIPLFFLWPLVPPVDYPGETDLVAHLLGVELTPLFLAQLLLAVLVFGLWYADGRPGWRDVRTAGRWITRQHP
jgi:hypothetical protein